MLMALAVGLTAACGSDNGNGGGDGNGGAGEPGGGGGGTLTMGLISAPMTFDASLAEWGNRLPFYQAVYDTLLVATPEGEIEPFLATEWEYNDDETQLSLTIRDGVTFSDGEELDAEAVALSMNRFKDGTGPDAGYMRYVTEIQAISEDTVQVDFEAADPAFLNYLTRTAGLVMSPAAVDNADLPTNPVGSGPYTLDVGATVTDTSYTFNRREGYWNPDVQHYDTIVMRVFQEPTAMLNALRAGEINVAKLSSADTFAEAEGAGWTMNSNELDFQGLLLLDRGGDLVPELADVRVRQAINYAVDAEALLQAVALGYGTQSGQVFPETSAAYDAALDDAYPFDPDRARELLAEAGVSDLTITMPRSAVLGSTVYNLVQQMLGDVGIGVDYEDPGQNFIADLLAPKYAVAFMALEQNPDWQLTQFMISPDSVFNPFNYQDDQVDAFLADYVATTDQDERDAIMGELNAYIVEQAWFAPFYRVEGIFASDADTQVEMLPTNTLPNLYDIKPTN